MSERADNDLLSDIVETKHCDIPWKNMARLRDKLIHHYFGVNLDVVWEIAASELPGVTSQLERIQGDEDR